MNTLLLGIGQAGTTISSIISQNLIEESKYFVNLNSISCKAFLIDSESKVISNILTQNKNYLHFFRNSQTSSQTITDAETIGLWVTV